MSTEETVEMLDEYGFEKFVLDSDISYAPSNHMALPETKHELEKIGVNSTNIDKVMFKNVSKLYNLTF
jgi:predicted metal-dependent TIM-barrel fold hydrolase